MKLSIGIVGLPNVGKSTLFNALLKKQVADVANYPFCTIEPNVGVVEVPDERLPVLAKMVNTQKIVPAVVEFYDIAGLVRGASTGEGLGNKFLSHIREVAAIAHVIRLFEDDNIIHVANKINPLDDLQTIESELMLADLENINKIQNAKIKIQNDKEKFKKETIDKIFQSLNQGIPIRNINLSDEEKEIIKPLNLLTDKPVIYIFNVSEKQLENKEKTEKKINVILSEAKNLAKRRDTAFGLDPSVAKLLQDDNSENYLYLCAKLESEIVALSDIDQKEYLKQYGLVESGLNRLIKQAYKTLGLISFLTAGEKEVRAWTIKRGTIAPQAAGVIHSDFEKHFIKADVIPYEKFVEASGWARAREQGLVQIVGKDYEIKDGEVVEFKVGI
ncbi:MAG: redox-regulated ATPase YchF [Candidatus Microgenomates bacterium]